MTRLWQARVLMAGLVVMQAAGGCGGSSSGSPTAPTTPPTSGRLEAGERAVTLAVNTVLRLVLQIHGSGTDSVAARSVAPEAAGPRGGESGLDTGTLACDQLTVTFYNAQGREQSVYNPATTTRITAVGTCVVSGVTLTFNLALTDTQASASSFLTNGTAEGSYEGLVVRSEIHDLRMPKQSCAYPISGQIICLVEDISVTVEFNGTSTAKATYSRGGRSYSFDIPLEFC